MKVELVQAVTDDDLILDGALLEPDGPRRRIGSVDAVLMMHGNSSNFYDSFYRYFAEELALHGVATLRANNRGHDVINRAVGPRNRVLALEAFHEAFSTYFGTGLENLDDCRRDWRTWIDHLRERNYRNVVVWGHSRGAVKSAYYMAKENDPRVVGTILASPPWFSYSRWKRSSQAALFERHLTEAHRHVEDGEPNALMWVKVPMEYVSGAAAYLDKYGPDERYNVIRNVASIHGPVLAMTGTEEVARRFAFDGLPDAFDEVRQGKANLTHLTIPGGDHLYTGVQDFVFPRVVEWMERLESS
jgi:hypothetical protein